MEPGYFKSFSVLGQETVGKKLKHRRFHLNTRKHFNMLVKSTAGT